VPHIDFETEFDYDCDRTAAFVPHPQEQKRAGYLVNLVGMKKQLSLKQDLTVYVPYNETGTLAYQGVTLTKDTSPNASRMYRTNVVGVIEKFTWRGGICDAITIDFFVSQENAVKIKSIVQAALRSTQVTTLAWWICAYDDETKLWFEQAYPDPAKKGVTGHINGRTKPILEAHLTPTKVGDNIDTNVYRAKISIVPIGEGTFNMCFAASPGKPVIRSWGVNLGQ